VYPINLTVRGRCALIAGGGAVAERKLRALLDAGADVTLVSPAITPGIGELAAAGRIRHVARRFEAADVGGAFLVFAATDRPEVNAQIVAAARAAGTLVNDAGDAERGDFATPAVHRSGPLTVSVASSGLAPSFTKRIRDELAVVFDTRYARAAANLGQLRERVQAVVPLERRAAVMRHFSERDIDDLAGMPSSEMEHEVERAADTVANVIPADPHLLVCASRASALAMVQTRMMMAQLAAAGIASTVLNITTRGDAVQDRALAAIGGDSLFVKELENALRDRRADYAVHSCKDLPSTLADDFTIAAITPREDPRDAFCSERFPSFDALPAGARVGTSSPRRRAQLHVLRPDLTYIDIRGNVDTRLRKLRDGDYDAIVLASAGLRRLGVAATYTVPFDPHELTPAVGQGALAIETRRADGTTARIQRALNDPQTNLCVRAERAYLRTLRGGCQAPVGAHATYEDGVLRLIAVIAALDGSRVVRGERYAELRGFGPESVTAGEALGVDLARELLAAGGSAILADVEGSAAGNGPTDGPLAGRLVLLPRTQDRPSRIAPALREAGAEVIEAADSDAARSALAGRLPAAILFPSSGSVAAITDYLAGLRDTGQRPVVAAMGPASSSSAGASGFPPDVVAPNAEVGTFVQTVTRFLLENGT
jgi:hydroxymethylbilane synthase